MPKQWQALNGLPSYNLHHVAVALEQSKAHDTAAITRDLETVVLNEGNEK